MPSRPNPVPRNVAILALLVAALFGLAYDQSHAPTTPTQPAPQEPELPGPGDTVKFQGWEITMVSVTPRADRVVADLRIRNIQNRPATFTPHDIVLRTIDRRAIEPAPWTAGLERGLLPREELPPGGTTERRVGFDAPAGAGPLILEAFEIE